MIACDDDKITSSMSKWSFYGVHLVLQRNLKKKPICIAMVSTLTGLALGAALHQRDKSICETVIALLRHLIRDPTLSRAQAARLNNLLVLFMDRGFYQLAMKSVESLERDTNVVLALHERNIGFFGTGRDSKLMPFFGCLDLLISVNTASDTSGRLQLDIRGAQTAMQATCTKTGLTAQIVRQGNTKLRSVNLITNVAEYAKPDWVYHTASGAGFTTKNAIPHPPTRTPDALLQNASLVERLFLELDTKIFSLTKEQATLTGFFSGGFVSLKPVFLQLLISKLQHF